MDVTGPSDFVWGYVFWCLFFGFGPMIWFYPMNQLDITGYEAFVVFLLVPPMFLDVSVVRKFFLSTLGNLLLEAGTLVGILSYHAPTTFHRLCLLIFGSMCALLKFTCNISSGSSVSKKRKFWGYTFGFLGFLVSRIFYRTISPVWNDETTNATVFAIVLGNLLIATLKKEGNSNSETPTKRKSIRKEIRPLPAALGLGSQLYLTHMVFGEISVVCRWTVRGYPGTGPHPVPWGLGVLAFLVLGISASRFKTAVFHPIFSIWATLAFVALYKLPGWMGFAGGLGLALYAGAQWPTYANFLAHSPEKSGRMVAGAMFMYFVEIFYSVWTVAYNFVPGGVYTREFTGLNIGVMMGSMFWSSWVHRSTVVAERDNHVAYTASGSCSKVWEWSKVKFWLAAVVLVASGGMAQRYVSYNPGSYVENTRNFSHFTTMIWTYHFGYDNNGWSSLERSAKLMSDLKADVIGLLETDASKPFMGNNDLASWLSERLQMYADFGPATKDHTWGNMLLSRFPILESKHLLLPSPHGELAPALSAILNVYGREVGVILTHMGNDRDNLDRKLQTEVLSDLAGKFYRGKIPTVFLGYVTSKPFQRDYRVFMERGKLKDIDGSDEERFCEYIFYRGLSRLGYARISHGGLTDTEIQVGKFRIERDFQEEERNSVVVKGEEEERMKRVEENVVFPPEFGEFFEGHYHLLAHHYHMGTPKYFVEKEL